MTLLTADPATDPAPELPRPTTTRYRPLRAGILNVWEYDDQEFWFEDGRMILRGGNEAGKTKALELLLPFLFDADLRPQRLDPFGEKSKTMHWNLVGFDEARRKAIGYVWLEFGRQSGGDQEFFTIGAGLSASAQATAVHSWFFTTRARIGADLHLAPGRAPLTRGGLHQALEGRGEVHDRQKDYREAVDAGLFGLGAERYAALIHLLLQLRRPHLSAKLDLSELSATLSSSLPPLDEDRIEGLSRAWDRLEADQAELDALDSARECLQAFLDVYRQYARQQARVRAGEVRSSVTRFDDVTRRVRRAEEVRDGAEGRIREIDLERSGTARRLEEREGERNGLEASDEMKLVGRLKEAREAAREDAKRHEEARRRQAEDEEQARSASEAAGTESGRARDAEEARDAQGRRVAAAAGPAALAARHETLAAGFEDDPDAVADALVAAAGQRLGEVDELRGLAAALEAEEHRAGRAGERVAEQREQRDEARQAEREAGRAEEEAAAGLEAAVLAWVGSEGVPDFAPEESTDLVDAVFRRVGAGQLAREEGDRATRPALERLEAEADGARVRDREARAELEAVKAERERVAAERELPPPPRTGRAEDRSGRAGDAFYRLVDFGPGVPEEDRRGLEAALDASGLLDAWVTPDGAMLGPDLLDVGLVSGAAAAGATLNEVLVPAGGGAVAEEVLRGILGRVGLVPSGAPVPEGGDFVSPDGRYRIGPLVGRWMGDGVRYIGAAARAAARARRLAELDRRIGEARAEWERRRAAAEEAQARRDALRRARERFPDGAGLLAARRELVLRVAELERLDRDLARAEGALAEALAVRDRARRALEDAARRTGLSDHLGDLAGLRDRVESYRRAVSEWRSDGRVARERRLGARRAEEQARIWERRALDGHAGVERLAGAAARSEAEATALEERFGKTAAELVRRREEVAAEIAALSERRRALEIESGDAREAFGRAAAELAKSEEQRALREAERQTAVDDFLRLVEVGLLEIFSDAASPAHPWTLTAAVDLARRVERETEGAPVDQAALEAGQNRVFRAYEELRASLSGDFDPALGEQAGVTCVTIGHNGRNCRLLELILAVGTEVEKRRELLGRKERELIEKHLLGEVGHHLQDRILAASRLVDEMNAQLGKHATNSGLTVRLRWSPAASDGETAEALAVLRKSVSLLKEEDRAGLVRFLRARVARAREDEGGGTGAERMARALDYRAWHEFTVLQIEDGTERRLTRKLHATGSGGSRAVLIHLPLFAAAAAHYRPARETAPHLILLDEAFAGIDPEQRGSLMGLLVDFDFDFLVTNHDEWGCYATLPGVAIYHLERTPGTPGVGALRFVWNGRERREEDPWLAAKTGEFPW